MGEPIAITIAECGRLLSVTRKHVYHLINTDPDFPRPFKLGRCTRVLRSEVIAYAANKAKRPMEITAADQVRSPHRRPTSEPSSRQVPHIPANTGAVTSAPNVMRRTEFRK